MDLDCPRPRCPFCADPMRFRRVPLGQDERLQRKVLSVLAVAPS